jgi:hypothetical protein
MEDCVIDGPTVEGGHSVTKITCDKVPCLERSQWDWSGGPAERFFGKYLKDLSKCPGKNEMEAAVQTASKWQIKKFKLTGSDKLVSMNTHFSSIFAVVHFKCKAISF